jgi:rare lipoprotein A
VAVTSETIPERLSVKHCTYCASVGGDLLRRIALAAVTVGLAASTVFAAYSPPRMKVQPKPSLADSNRDVLKAKQTPYRPKRKKHLYTFIVTAYTANDTGMNGRGITASGKRATPFHTVAASPQWPIGTQFKTPDGQIWVVEDRGGAIQDDDRLDLYVGRNNKRTAYQWGVRKVQLQLIKLGEGR